MALAQIRRSDKSGKDIPEGTGARVRIIWFDGRPDMRADLTDEEVAEVLPFAVPVVTRPTRRGKSSAL